MHFCETFAYFENVVCDGRMVNTTRDPPGQRSVYILPGEPQRETYRLATFKNFPSNVQVDLRKLASNGFYFTGYKDRVKCFSCGQCVEEWKYEDDPTSQRWHKTNCDFILGRDDTNVSIDSLYGRIGITSVAGNPEVTCSTGNTHVQERQALHQTLLGENMNHEFTLHASSSSNITSASLQQSATISSDSTSTSYAISTSRANEADHRNLITLQRNRNLFPCLNPVNPHMRSEESRVQTFLDHSSSWPAHRIRATPRQIANAGMYYLGVRDRVKCWYCNGGLQNWERDDDPWEDHAKWFPTCEFLLQQKGVNFVHQIASRFPNLRRPNIIGYPANITSLRAVESGSRTPRNQLASNLTPRILDPREEGRLRMRRINEEMSSSELVKQAQLMGFEDRMIREALKKKYETANETFLNFETLLEGILAELNDQHHIRSLPSFSITPATSASSLTTTSGLREIRRLEQERLCKKCGKEQASVVLIPCGHIACCVACAENLETCPICRSSVREKFRSFMV
ncbi:unnamed protein product [Clavelina lepadiformis]|uniref:RING-type domain-containing protein n=1 Tax=Clavelina lepadiformis TaxID=159417 RepID=A0ABP0GVM2_CLALP